MTTDRRGFLKIAGLATVAGVGAAKVADALAGEGQGTHSPHAGAKKAERWAMVIDTRKCMKHEGCTDCMDACHAVHNVPHWDDPKDEIKWIWKQDAHGAFPEQMHEYLPHSWHDHDFLVLCNHCDEPPCVKVCPTRTTFKREDGIVMMDMHRCIGCRYCMTACPYGSRSFNWRDPRLALDDIKPEFPTRTKGVVEKCNFCAERLAQGLMPACVEACPHEALVFGDLNDEHSAVREILDHHNTIRRKPALGTKPEVFYLV